ncbi:MAG: hypothetical protein IJ921_04910 [Paludibacteraceae bacterium]|nr:hypothetical protein [Paludibacteraceae bacterium]
MTEQEFSRQVWRMYDKITTAEGVPGKVLGVSFTTKSVRAYISGAPEWIRCESIETHTTGKGADGDDTAIIEELHNKVLAQAERIGKLEEERRLLQEKISRNYLGELLRAVNVMQQGLQERKKKHEQIESSLSAIAAVIEKMKSEE